MEGGFVWVKPEKRVFCCWVKEQINTAGVKAIGWQESGLLDKHFSF